MRSLTRTRTPFSEADLLSIDDRIAKATSEGRATVPLARYDRANNPISGLVDGIPAERQIDMKLLENEALIEDVLRKASGQSPHLHSCL